MLTLIIFYCSLLLFTNNSSLTPISDVCLTDAEKELFSLVNDYRKSKNLEAIPYSAALTKVAQAHVRDLHENYTYDPNAKCNPHSWSKKGDWSSCCYTNDHKQAQCMWDKPMEIAGYDSHGYEIAYYQSNGAVPSVALDGWKVSKGHNQVMINLDIWSKVTWQGMGVGLYKEYAVVWFGAKSDPGEMLLCN